MNAYNPYDHAAEIVEETLEDLEGFYISAITHGLTSGVGEYLVFNTNIEDFGITLEPGPYDVMLDSYGLGRADNENGHELSVGEFPQEMLITLWKAYEYDEEPDARSYGYNQWKELLIERLAQFLHDEHDYSDEEG